MAMTIYVLGFWDGENLMPVGFHRDPDVAKSSAKQLSTDFSDTIMVQMWKEYDPKAKVHFDTPVALFKRGEELDLKGLTG